MTMKKGEVALLTIAPEYAFGSTGSKQELAVVPPNATVTYEIELISFIKEKESWDMNTHEKIEVAGKNKEEGNAFFKAGKYTKAVKPYEKAAKFIEYDTNFEEEEKKQAKALKVMCWLTVPIDRRHCENSGFYCGEEEIEFSRFSMLLMVEARVVCRAKGIQKKIIEITKAEATAL